MEFLYRAMADDQGRPKLGSSATTLGVRKGKDIDIDDTGEVSLPDFSRGARNGMSCAPTVADLPDFSLPEAWGGANRRSRIWRIPPAKLGPELVAGVDKPGHVSIGPAYRISFAEFVAAIERTAEFWELVTLQSETRDESETGHQGSA
jgi:hypothetical protein